MNLILFFLAIIIFIEILFSILYFLKNQTKYIKKKKYLYSKIHYTDHPHLPFVLKKKFKAVGRKEINYPIKKKYKFIAPELKSNNLGFYNGNNGDKAVSSNKKENLIRINCLGGSTTMNYLVDNNNINTSYPIELQKVLNRFKKNRYEVNNFGQGLYNSTDLIIRYITSIIYTKPDIIILYIGYNDIRSYLTDNFTSDNSHSRKNLNFSKFQIFLNFIFYDFKLNFLNYLLSKTSIYNFRESLTNEVTCGNFNLNNSPEKGLEIFSKNVELLIALCKHMKTRLIMSSFCHYKYAEIKNNKLHQKFHKIVDEENKILKKLAKKNNIEFVDNSTLVERKDINFVDSIHFSKEGMKKLANNFFKKIIKSNR